MLTQAWLRGSRNLEVASSLVLKRRDLSAGSTANLPVESSDAMKLHPAQLACPSNNQIMKFPFWDFPVQVTCVKFEHSGHVGA